MHRKSFAVLVALCVIYAGLVGATVSRDNLSASWMGERVGVGIGILVVLWIAGLLAVRSARALRR